VVGEKPSRIGFGGRRVFQGEREEGRVELRVSSVVEHQRMEHLCQAGHRPRPPHADEPN